MTQNPAQTPPGEWTNAVTQELVVNAGYEVFVLAIVLLSIVNSILVFLLSGAQQQVVLIVEAGISLFLFTDAFWRLFRAPDKRRFWREFYGWMVFLGSLPVPFLRILRLVRTGLIARRLKKSDYQAIGKITLQKRANSTLLAVVFAAIVVLEIGGLLILRVEATASNANIRTASDALWWGIVTVATVGYGDRFPVSNAGRLVGVAMIVAGVGLFTAITSFLAQWFLTPRRQSDQADTTDQDEPLEPAAHIQDLRHLIRERDDAHREWLVEVEARLAKLERSLPSK